MLGAPRGRSCARVSHRVIGGLHRAEQQTAARAAQAAATAALRAAAACSALVLLFACARWAQAASEAAHLPWALPLCVATALIVADHDAEYATALMTLLFAVFLASALDAVGALGTAAWLAAGGRLSTCHYRSERSACFK